MDFQFAAQQESEGQTFETCDLPTLSVKSLLVVGKFIGDSMSFSIECAVFYGWIAETSMFVFKHG